jgi:transcriptional regulator with XRE-family HTH domain
MKLATFAHLLGVSPGHLSNIETNNVPASYELYVKAAQILECNPCDLVSETTKFTRGHR